ncbi:uncharacterized protein EAF01_010967 [Botrytis porri]|uniref:uncharacterized protein n=1 Tax=Botrytis porri TaxID=87229 RepID=UPI001901D132|nr:uncharacterized protein EAF01_010967 [Botrytis porri]KAF7887813.1 hypothetical protein EAF01_010967 [Botrytis porri]
MTNKRRSSLSVVEALVGPEANKRRRIPIPNTITPIKAIESMEELKNKEELQTASLLPSQNLSNMDIDCQKLKLPQEILRLICSHVGPHELSNLRFVSKDLSNAAATCMFKEISFKFEALSFQNLLNIADNSNLQRHVSKLTYKGQFIDDDGINDSWSPQHADYHFHHQYELADALKRLSSLNTIRIDTIFCDPIPEYFLITNGSFDTFWNFLKSTLVNVSNLRTIGVELPRLESNIYERERSLKSFSKLEIDKLEKLKDFQFLVNKFLIPHVPALLNCMQNLRSLSLGEATEAAADFQYWHDSRDFSQLVNPSTIFPSLESLEIKNLYLNEQYFQEFLLINANSLRSLKLHNVRIELIKEDLESKEHLKSNSWIRMFYFFAQSLHLKVIRLSGILGTSCSGFWSSECYCEDGCKRCDSSSLMLSLQNFITHVEGSSFPLPHPDEDLRNVDMKSYFFGYGFDAYIDTSDPGFYWRPNPVKRREIRLLEKEPLKPATFKGFMSWSQSESDSDSDSDEYSEEEEEEEEEGEEGEDNPTQRAAFDYAMTQIRINRTSWTDVEKKSLINTLLEGLTEENE